MSTDNPLSLTVGFEYVQPPQQDLHKYAVIASVKCRSTVRGFLTLRLFWPEVVPVTAFDGFSQFQPIDRDEFSYREYRRSEDVHLFSDQTWLIVGRQPQAQFLYEVDHNVFDELHSRRYKLFYELHLDDTPICAESKPFKSMHEF